MNYEEACQRLELTPQEGHDRLVIKAHFRRLSLQYHPDKNDDPNATAQFQAINEAYRWIMDDIDAFEDEDEDEIKPDSDSDPLGTTRQWVERLAPLFRVVVQGMKFCNLESTEHSKWRFLRQFVMKTYETNALSFLDTMEKETLQDVYYFVCKHRRRFEKSGGGALLEHIGNLLNLSLHQRTRKDEFLVFYPTLKDLFDCNVIQHHAHGQMYAIPTWFEETVFDQEPETDQEQEPPLDPSDPPGRLPGGEIVVHCIPSCPEGVVLDDAHHVNKTVRWTLAELWSRPNDEPVAVELVPGHSVSFNKRMLYMRPYQTLVFWGKGVPIGNPKDPFDVSKKSNVVLHLHVT